MTTALGITDEETITSKLTEAINEFITAARSDPQHPAKERFNAIFTGLAAGMATGRHDAVSVVNDLLNRFTEDPATASSLAGMLQYAREKLLSAGYGPGTALEKLLGRGIHKITTRLQEDTAMRQQLELWLQDTIVGITNVVHPELSRIITATLDRMDDSELSRQLEEKIGRDLQYIRLNGAVVGGIAGMAIYTLQYITGI